MTEETQLVPPKKTSKIEIWSLDCDGIPSYGKTDGDLLCTHLYRSSEAGAEPYRNAIISKAGEEVGTMKD